MARMSSPRRRSHHRHPRTSRREASDPGAPAVGSDAAVISGVPLRGLAWVVPPSLVAPVPARPGDQGGDLASVMAPAPRRFFGQAERLAVVIDVLRAALIRHDLEHPVVWSIDCGAGEELFSLAIAASEELGPLATRLRLLGSDPDATAIEAARAPLCSTCASRMLTTSSATARSAASR